MSNVSEVRELDDARLWNHRMQAGSTKELRLSMLLAAYVLVWTGTQALVATNLDGFADMLENYAWGQTIVWGSFKHPPLVGWVAGLWFRLFPEQDSAYFLLSYASAAVGLLGVHRLAVATGLGRVATAAVLLQMFALPYATLAAKFNANTVLLPLWPWVAYAWWSCVYGERKSWTMALVLGATAALAMLGKYYSGVLLLGLGLLTVGLPVGRQWLRTGKPWLALIVLMALLMPHLLWLGSHDYVTFRYLGEQGGEGVGWVPLLKFMAAPLLYWGIALAVCVAWFRNDRLRWWHRAWLAWRPTGRDDALFWVVMLPYGLTLLFGLSGGVELSLPWAIPIGFGFPLLWLRNLSRLGAHGDSGSRLPLRKWLLVVLSLVVGGGLAEGVRGAVQGAEITYLPRREAAHQLLLRWDALHPAGRPAWVGGLWAENAALAFYGAEDLHVIPGLPDAFPASLDHELAERWPREPGLIYCPPMARSLGAQADCEARTLQWLQAHHLPIRKIAFDVRREGWRFPLQRPFRYTAFMVLPAGR